jgi:hypothetical protein
MSFYKVTECLDHLTDEELLEKAKKQAEALGLPPPGGKPN